MRISLVLINLSLKLIIICFYVLLADIFTISTLVIILHLSSIFEVSTIN